MITHDLTEVHAADKIIVLGKTGVIAEGTHPELLESCALYQQLSRKKTDKNPPALHALSLFNQPEKTREEDSVARNHTSKSIEL